MKVRFNNPRKSFTNKFSFDNNTTFGIGNVQPLFCKQLCSGSKISVNFNQLTRLSPLVVPTFARLKQRNDFAFVPMAMVMPSFDAFLSSSLIKGTKKDYVPKSVPCTTNADLFISLCSKVPFATCTILKDGKYLDSGFSFTDTYGRSVSVSNMLTTPAPNLDQLKLSYFDFVLDNSLAIQGSWSANSRYCVKLTSLGRFWFSVLRGLGYTLDPNDTLPVSILPLWAFVKAYYDLYYPKRDNPWHASTYYADINAYYNGDFAVRQVGSLYYDMVLNSNVLHALFGTDNTFDFFAPVDDSLASAATTKPINYNSKASNNNTFDNANDSDRRFNLHNNDGNPQNVPTLSSPIIRLETAGISADQLTLVNRLWNFVQKSSVVGQSVKDWFKVHLGVGTNEDMFDQTLLVDSVVNDVSINAVISTAQTTGLGPDGGDHLGALAGQGYASKNGSIHFEARTFGFFMCLTSLVPVSGVSCGTQPELYLNTLYEQQMPEFDAVGYEALNKSSFLETYVDGNDRMVVGDVKGGFGYVPRLSSWKSFHNIRSGNFAVNSVKDSLIPYNIDVLPKQALTAGILWRFPWSQSGRFVSFNRMFYNIESGNQFYGMAAPLDDNFMCQTAFDVSYTSYLKPLSDSFSVESLGKDLVSVKEQ
jgi:hypothetical protein